MEQNPYTVSATPLPKASDYLKQLGGVLGNDPNNEGDNPYTGSAPASPAPSMGPHFQALADAGGMGGAARALAPAVSAATSRISPAIPAAASAVAGAASSPSFDRFNQYLSQYRMQGKRDFSKESGPQNIDDMMARVAMRESSGNATARNKSPDATASGLFQHIHSTWGGHGGFDAAADAPPEMQYNRMLSDLAGSLKRNGGDVPRSLLDHYEGAGNTQKILKNPSLLYGAPGKYNGNETGYKRIASLIGDDKAAKWATDHQSKLADAKGALENVYNTADPQSVSSTKQAPSGAGGGVY